MAAIHAMKGPRKILELDGKPKSRWHLDSDALHLFEGKLWAWETCGCILCAEASDSGHQTLVREDDGGEDHYYCLCHGALDKVDYSITRLCEVTIGGVTREFKDTESDFLLFPADMDPEARAELTEAMIKQAQEEARRQDWLDTTDDDE